MLREREGERDKGTVDYNGTFLDRENGSLKVGNFKLTSACGFLNAR